MQIVYGTAYYPASSLDAQKMFDHLGHKLEIASYEDSGTVLNLALECLQCNEVIADWDVMPPEVA